MLSQFTKRLLLPHLFTNIRRYSIGGCISKTMKVTVVGASEGIGPPLSLMLKQSTVFDEVCLYDAISCKGVGLDLSHVDTRCKVCAWEGVDELDAALANSMVVLVVTGTAAKSDKPVDQFRMNALQMKQLAEAVARNCPDALVGLATSPVNSLVPVFVESMAGMNVHCPGRKVFGVTALDGVRAASFAADLLHVSPECVRVPVVGGRGGDAVVPLFTSSQPKNAFRDEEVQMLTYAVQQADHVVLQAKQSPPTLSAAFAVARFAISLANALMGQRGVVECAFVKSDVVPDVGYFATPLQLGPAGVERYLALPAMSEYECQLLAKSLPLVQAAIALGEDYVRGKKSQPYEKDEVCSDQRVPCPSVCPPGLESKCRADMNCAEEQACPKA